MSRVRIEEGKYYIYTANAQMGVMKCLARYEQGGVAVYHSTDFEGKPVVRSEYLKDIDLLNGVSKAVNKPIIGFVNIVYDGNIDEKRFDKQVYESKTLALSSFEAYLKNNPYARLIETIEINPRF